ncbi:MAG: shikimate dehydrogenase, partial [Clostridia bacterium]|nr:shikimate dehydrogenase [Clostridia bacterium]
MAGRFGFILHPLDVVDVGRKYPIARHLPPRLVEGVLRRLPPLYTSHITGVASPYNRAEGWFVSVPLTTRQMTSLPADIVLDRIVAAGRLAERRGAGIIGLGAFTAIVGDAGVTVARRLDAGVTTGNSYTAATAVEGAEAAARFMGIDLDRAEVAVVGATGSIGRACALLWARRCRRLTLIGRDEARLEAVATEVLCETGTSPQITTDLRRALPVCDVILTVSSA